MIRGTAKKGLKRIAAGCIAAVCVIGCTQGSIVTARAGDSDIKKFPKEFTVDEIKESIKKYVQSLDNDDPHGSSDLQTYIMNYIEGECDYDKDTPGDYYNPDSSLLVHVDENKLVTAYASDGLNKWPIEYSWWDYEGNYTGWTTDGTNITIVKHPDADYRDYYNLDDEGVKAVNIEDGLSVAPIPDIPAPPISKKVDWITDTGSFSYMYAFNRGYVCGKYTTYISRVTEDDDVELSGESDDDTLYLVIRSTRITGISKKAFPIGDIGRLKIYLPKEKFKVYKAMILQVPTIKKIKKTGKVKFYTLDKWNGKVSTRRYSDIEFVSEPRTTQAITGGEWYKENIIASREEALKNTNIKKGSKAYKELVERHEYHTF